MTVETGIIVTFLLAVILVLLIYKEINRLHDEIDYLELREEVEIEKAFLTGVTYGRKNNA